ncbi:cupin domain-containing protein [Sphingorhabdus sp. EL138]|uniref:cupin domain-containing protein n=1 Tax=Sphingorhabdus sp. EL138 TaxID=2073156 RepID=UPI000D691E68|nr:cupin domain-containing protein [Sphingorhabdus sp. EL138]
MQLTDFNPDTFLQDYWQKKPLLIKNPWRSWEDPLEPDDLAGLACEEGVESRLITQTDAAGGWALEQGPFPETRFGELGEEQWTLLVQAVDHYVPEVAALIEPFRFIPNWRIDDVMVSYATEGGGVGPHFDQYDVFLIQGLGQRRWQVGVSCDEDTNLMPHDDLRLLANFDATDEWICEPGDIVYIPPGVAHNGVAVDQHCMTYSIGFRAPSRSELIGYWIDDLLADMKDDDRYGDPVMKPQENPGEIQPEAIQRLHNMIMEKIGDREAFARWFGQYSSTPKYPDVDWRTEEAIGVLQIRKNLASGLPLYRNPASRFSYIRQSAGSVLLFVDGACYTCADQTSAFAEQLCVQDRVELDEKFVGSDDVITLISELYDRGSLIFDNNR